MRITSALVALGCLVFDAVAQVKSLHVLFVYTDDLAEANSPAAINGIIDAAVAEMNQAFQNSRVDIRVRAVAREMVAMDEVQPECGDLASRAVAWEEPEYVAVRNLKGKYSADAVFIITERVGNGGTCAVAAGICGYNGVPCNRDFGSGAFAQADRAMIQNQMSFSHEMGHLLGLDHDRATLLRESACSPNQSPTDCQPRAFPYSFGHVGPNENWVTIMAKPTDNNYSKRILYFSNPDIQHPTRPGEFLGVAGGPTPSNASLSLNNVKDIVTEWKLLPDLVNGSERRSNTGESGAQLYFKIEAPPGASNLRFRISGGTGDADLYVKKGDYPYLDAYDCRPYLGGNEETCDGGNGVPGGAGSYYILIHGYSAFNEVTVDASYQVEYQAEAYTTRSGVDFKTAEAGYTGSGYMDYGSASSYLEWNNVETGWYGNYTIGFRYANGSTLRKCRLYVNGQDKGEINFPGTGSWSTWQEVGAQIQLYGGPNTIRLVQTTSGGPNLDKLTFSDPSVITMQAESADLWNNVYHTDEYPGYIGSGYLVFQAAGSSLQWEHLNVPAAGVYSLGFRYALATTGTTKCRLYVNGIDLGEKTFHPTGSWSAWSEAFWVANLKAGVNIVKIVQTTATGPHLDQFDAVVSPQATFQQDIGLQGLVSMEGEHFWNNIPKSGFTWSTQLPSGFTGEGAMQVLPNNGANHNTGYVATSPRLDFRVNFIRTGVHYVWARGLGATASDDSFHAGLDGQALTTSNSIHGFNNSWKWSRATIDGPVATLNVTTVGEHVVNIWMREDGFILDKLVLTTRSDYIPTGTGPTESPRN